MTLYSQLYAIHNYHKKRSSKTQRDAAQRAKIRAKIVPFGNNQANMTGNVKKS